MHRFRENPCIEIIDPCGRVPGWGTASVNAKLDFIFEAPVSESPSRPVCAMLRVN